VEGARGDAVGRGTAFQAGRSRVRFPMWSLGFFIDSASNTNEYLLGGKCGRCVGLTTLPPSCVDRLEILGASTSCSPKGLSRPVKGWLFYPLWIVLLALHRPRSVAILLLGIVLGLYTFGASRQRL
jgi:hypothetical protein